MGRRPPQLAPTRQTSQRRPYHVDAHVAWQFPPVPAGSPSGLARRCSYEHEVARTVDDLLSVCRGEDERNPWNAPNASQTASSPFPAETGARLLHEGHPVDDRLNRAAFTSSPFVT